MKRFIPLNDRLVDRSSIEVDCCGEVENSFIKYAEFDDESPLNDDELDALTAICGELIMDAWFDRQVEKSDWILDSWKDSEYAN